VTDLVQSFKRFRPGRDRRGLVFVLSDLFGRAPERSEQAARRAASWMAETHVIHIVHPREKRPDLVGELQLVEVETQEVRRLWLTKRELHQYERVFEDYQERLRKVCMNRQIDYVPWPTDQPFEDMFLNLLSRGSALAGA
jgi:hypothetical protein